jgi:hypothetical protein
MNQIQNGIGVAAAGPGWTGLGRREAPHGRSPGFPFGPTPATPDSYDVETGSWRKQRATSSQQCDLYPIARMTASTSD